MFAHAFGCKGLVTLDVGAELAGLVADAVGVAGGGHDLCIGLVDVVRDLVWWQVVSNLFMVKVRAGVMA